MLFCPPQPLHGVPGHTRLISRLRVTRDLVQTGVSADGGDLVGRAPDYGMSGGGSLPLEAGELDHLAPFLGFGCDELSEVGGRERKHIATDVGKPRLQLGIGAPRGTPPEVIEMLNREINAGLASPGIKARYADLGGTAFSGTPTDFGKFIVEDTEKWAKVVKLAGLG